MTKKGIKSQNLSPRSQVPKSPKRTRWEIRGLDIIFDNTTNITLQEILEHLKKLKNGIHACFIIRHTENNKNHIHCGIHLRDKPKSLYYQTLSKHFQFKTLKCRVQKLKNPSRSFSAKLQTYYDYCMDESKHEGQIISNPLLHKWIPLKEEEKIKPKHYIYNKIRLGFEQEDLDKMILDETLSLKLFIYITENYNKIIDTIEIYNDCKISQKQAQCYLEETKKYRPFQKSLTDILNNQNDRHIHIHYDDGNTGKNFWLDIESMRTDTLILQNSKTKRIAAAWNPKKHKRIIFDIPKGKMEFLNTSVIENLKNGTVFSTMYHPKMKQSLFKPSIIILGNEQLPIYTRTGNRRWTEGRQTQSTTNNNDFIIKFLTEEEE